MAGIYDTDYPSAAIADWDAKGGQYEHGVDGHTGYKCGACALLSVVRVAATSHSVDYYQTKQLEWQEECDVIMGQFDLDVAAHFPLHKAVNCQECPVTGILPTKPVPPVERALKQRD